MIVQVPQSQPPNVMARVNTATEYAFGALLKAAIAEDLSRDQPMGLMYLPDESVTRQFQLACRAVLHRMRLGAVKERELERFRKIEAAQQAGLLG